MPTTSPIGELLSPWPHEHPAVDAAGRHSAVCQRTRAEAKPSPSSCLKTDSHGLTLGAFSGTRPPAPLLDPTHQQGPGAHHAKRQSKALLPPSPLPLRAWSLIS